MKLIGAGLGFRHCLAAASLARMRLTNDPGVDQR